MCTGSYRHYCGIAQGDKIKSNNLFVFLHSQCLLLAGQAPVGGQLFWYTASSSHGQLFRVPRVSSYKDSHRSWNNLFFTVSLFDAWPWESRFQINLKSRAPMKYLLLTRNNNHLRNWLINISQNRMQYVNDHTRVSNGKSCSLLKHKILKERSLNERVLKNLIEIV